MRHIECFVEDVSQSHDIVLLKKHEKQISILRGIGEAGLPHREEGGGEGEEGIDKIESSIVTLRIKIPLVASHL